MEYMTAQEAAEKWGISDRRVRILCAEGKIEGVNKEGRAYRIPANAKRPADSRIRGMDAISEKDIFGYLKWGDHVIGIINRPANAVLFTDPEYNEIVAVYTRGQRRWLPEQFADFLSERVVSRDRRDIERILFRCGLSQYDVMRIAGITRGMHPRDLLWIAYDKDETLESAMTDVFGSVFLQRIDLTGESIDTPEGYNIKRYGVYQGQYGI